MSDPETATPPASVSPEQDIESYLDTGKPRKWYKRKRVWAGIILLILLLFALSRCMGEDPKPNYVTAEVASRSLDLTVTATGNLRPTNQVEVGSEISGRIDRILVDVNDQVVRGQVLAVINTDVIQDQIDQNRASLNAARAQIAQAQATLSADSAQLERLREVERLSGGRVPSDAELEQAIAAVKRGQAAVASARANASAVEAQLSTAQNSSANRA